MNTELIRKYERQCWNYQANCLDAVKFALLIAKECADIANKQFTAASGLDDRDCWTAVEIKKHFGVEEK